MKPEILKSYDEAIREALTDILNLNSMNESIWNQCTLPVKDGGLGIRSAAELALPAFLSSVRASIGTTRSLLPSEISEEANSFFDRGCEEWKQKLGVSELPHNQIFQSEWDAPICKQKFQNLSTMHQMKKKEPDFWQFHRKGPLHG